MASSCGDDKIYEPDMQSELLDTIGLSNDFDGYLNDNSDAQHIIEASPTGIPLTATSKSSKKALEHRRDYIHSRDSPFVLDKKNGCWKHRQKKSGNLRSIVLKHDILNVLLQAYTALEYKGVHSIWGWVESRYFGILRRDVEKFLDLVKKRRSTTTGLQRTTNITNQKIKESQISKAEDIEVQIASPPSNSYSSRPSSQAEPLIADQSQSLEGLNWASPRSSPKDFSAVNPSLRTMQSPETSHSASTVEAIYYDKLPIPLESETNSENLATMDPVDRPSQEILGRRFDYRGSHHSENKRSACVRGVVQTESNELPSLTTSSAKCQVSSLPERSYEFLKLKDALLGSKKAVIIAGAGISVQAGIPDFRSYEGLFAGSGKYIFDWPVMHSTVETSLHSYQKLQDLAAACKDAVPTSFHILMDSLAARGRLMRLYTQNVDCIDTAMSNLKTEVPLVWRISKKSRPLTVQLHGSILHFQCGKCQHICEYSGTMSGDSNRSCPECQKYVQHRTLIRGQRATDIGTLYPRFVFYNDPRLLDQEAISRFVVSDCKKRPDVVLVVGTSLTLPSVRRLIQDLSIPGEGGQRPLLIWLNKQLPPSSLQVVWDSIICEDLQDVAQDLLSYL